MGSRAASSNRADCAVRRLEAGSLAPKETTPISIASRTDAAPVTDPVAVSGRVFWSIFLVLFALTALPVLMVDVPPLFDYPNHLARMYLLGHLPHLPALRAYYVLHWAALPNLAMDLLVPTLAQVMPLDWAAKAFILATFALI